MIGDLFDSPWKILIVALPTVLPMVVLLHSCCYDHQHAAPGRT
jgi:hypothetical protein